MTRSPMHRQMEPLDALLRLQQELEQVFERPFGWFTTSTAGRGAFPPANIFRGEDGYVVRFEIPGVRAQEIEIETQHGALRVSGKRGAAESVGSPHRVERWSGAFSRSIQLPSDADLASASAQYRHGILSVSVPLRESARSRKIQVQQ